MSMLICCRGSVEGEARSSSCSQPSDSVAMPSATDTAVLLREGSGESRPEPSWPGSGQPSPRLLGGGEDTCQSDARHTNGFSSHCSSNMDHAAVHQSSVGKAVLGKGSSSSSMHAAASTGMTGTSEGDATDKQHKDGRQHSILVSEAEAGEKSRGAQPGQGPGCGQELGEELQQACSLGSASMASSTTSIDARLYEGLDSLQGDPSTMGDLSSESEEDATVAAERLRLGDFDVKVRRLRKERLDCMHSPSSSRTYQSSDWYTS